MAYVVFADVDSKDVAASILVNVAAGALLSLVASILTGSRRPKCVRRQLPSLVGLRVHLLTTRWSPDRALPSMTVVLPPQCAIMTKGDCNHTHQLAQAASDTRAPHSTNSMMQPLPARLGRQLG